MSRSRYRPRWSRRRERIGAPARDRRRDEPTERGYVRCDFVPLHGRPRVTRTMERRTAGWVLAAIENLVLEGFTRGGEVTIDYTEAR